MSSGLVNPNYANPNIMSRDIQLKSHFGAPDVIKGAPQNLEGRLPTSVALFPSSTPIISHPSSTMMQNLPTDSSSSYSSSTTSRRTPETTAARSGIYCVAGGAAAPMPSLMSHPPLQQIIPQTHLVLHGSPGMPLGSPTLGQLPSSSWPYSTNSRTPSPSSSRGSSPGPSSHSSPNQDFPCPYCHLVYKKVGHLNRHVLTHSGTRFRCEVKSCDKTFSRLDNMRTHVKNMHPGTA